MMKDILDGDMISEKKLHAESIDDMEDHKPKKRQETTKKSERIMMANTLMITVKSMEKLSTKLLMLWIHRQDLRKKLSSTMSRHMEIRDPTEN